MNKGIIYIIQPAELINTNRYKIGCSLKNNLDRCKNGYKIGTRYLYIMECDDPLLLEKEIKDEFIKKFKLIAGREYFEGNKNIMLSTFLEIINNYKLELLKISKIEMLKKKFDEGLNLSDNKESDVDLTIDNEECEKAIKKIEE